MNQTANTNSLPIRAVLSFSSPDYERRFIEHYVASQGASA